MVQRARKNTTRFIYKEEINMNYKYIDVPTSVTLKEIIDNGWSLTPSKYSRYSPRNGVSFKTMYDLTTQSFKKNKIFKNQNYSYTEIGDINVNTGKVDANNFWGLTIPSESPKQIKKGDILLSTVRTYRGGVGIVTEDLNNHVCSPALMVIRNVDNDISKEYLFSILKTDFFIEQILGFQNRGMYPRLDKEALKQILIPIPKNKKIIDFITLLTKAYLNKYDEIKSKHKKILSSIEDEIKSNQKRKQFNFKNPSFGDLYDQGRLDTGLYNETFKKWQHYLKNYTFGSIDLMSRGFDWARGTSLENNSIKNRIDSDSFVKGFYELVLPTNISEYGFVEKINYIGTPTNLKTISKGDIIFGGEGFGKGRTYVVVEDSNNVATNYHGIRIINKNKNLNESIFIRCFLAFWRSKGMIDFIGVGGSGGHCAPSYFHLIETPLFPEEKLNEITKLYYNAEVSYNIDKCNLDTFLKTDTEFNINAGIYQLDKTAKQLKEKLNKIIDDIVNDREINIKFK
jgi:hypothetical protein